MTPLGASVAESWDNLCAGVSGAGYTKSFDITDFPVKISCEIDGFDPNVLFKTQLPLVA